MSPNDDFLPEPPPEAYSDLATRDINNDWIREAEEDDQVAAMADWFGTRFWDPANETPYISAEGGYIWVHGGPYDATDVLYGRFSGVVPDNVIDRAVELVEQDCIYEWAPTQLTYYDSADDVLVDERYTPTQVLEARLQRLRSVLTLSGPDEARIEARKLAYAGVIAALESFLWETMAHCVERYDSIIPNLVTKLPAFRDRTIKLGAVYDAVANLKTEVRAHLKRVVWHRADSVVPLFMLGLGVKLSLKDFDEAIQTRHDIVHRSGHGRDGEAIEIADADVTTLAGNVLKFANELDGRISAAMRGD